MSSPIFAITPSLFDSVSAGFINANGTAAKIVVEVSGPAAADAVNSQPQRYGGQSLIDLTATSTDASARDLTLWAGKVLTTVGALTGAVSGAAAVFTRVLGDFKVEGWKVGDDLMAFDTNASQHLDLALLPATVTAVSATQLTLAGATLPASLSAGARLIRVATVFRASIAANAGTSASVPSGGLLNHSLDGSSLRGERKLGAQDVLVAAMATAVTAGARVALLGQVARY